MMCRSFVVACIATEQTGHGLGGLGFDVGWFTIRAKSLEPASSAVPNAADKQHYDDSDQKSCGIHVVLLLGDKRGPWSGYS
jgi:hypothetical protein